MEHKNCNHHNGGGNGFIFGFFAGVLVTLLFSTKKGREILRLLTEKGIEKFSDIEGAFEDPQDEEDVDGENDYVAPEEGKGIKYLAKDEEKSSGSSRSQESKTSPSKRGLRRFFKKH